MAGGWTETGGSTETSYLVFRLVPYGESSEIVGGVSPEHGRLSFMVHGVGRSNRRGGNPFGLFRKLRVRFRLSDRDIQSFDEAEILSDYGALSHDYQRYVSGCWLSRLCLQNVLPGISVPCFFRSLDVALERLASGEGSVACIETGVILVCLEENGWLPSWEDGSREEEQCRALLEMGMGGAMPRLRDENWRELRTWALGILSQTECVIPLMSEGGGVHGPRQ